MTAWIFPANPKYYDIQAAFREMEVIDWTKVKSISNINKDDIVYIYVTKPIQKILFKTIVENENISKNKKIDDSKFYKKDEKDNSVYVRLKKIEEYSNDESNVYNRNNLSKYMKGNIQSARKVNSNLLAFLEDNINLNMSFNTIYYGVPGTGKSYEVDQKLASIPDENKFRTTFHPEYTYSDFVGQITPDIDASQKPIYKYQKGIFTQALDRALEVPEQPVALVLEEMSRANIAAVFGDIFQLLDRDINGRSEYEINNNLIFNHLKNKDRIENRKVYLPSNLYIIGTVNTSDQNVFPIDTAFKRRFAWEYIPLTTPDADNNPKFKIDGIEVTWAKFLEKLNQFIVDKKEGLGLSEDKQIGPYFLKFNDLEDQEQVMSIIKNKLLQYLWEDVQNSAIGFGSNNNSLFKNGIDSFSSLYAKFGEENVFSKKFQKLLGKTSAAGEDSND